VFQRYEKTVTGKVDDIPHDLLIDLADSEDGTEFIGQQVREAEDVFLRAYFGTKLKKAWLLIW
jgi:hypothetical protein